ncbi:hypothetical protein D3C76_1742060 [compost metagenome]
MVIQQKTCLLEMTFKRQQPGQDSCTTGQGQVIGTGGDCLQILFDCPGTFGVVQLHRQGTA